MTNNKFINEVVNGWGEQFFLLDKDHEENTTGDFELHDLNSSEPLAVGEEAIEKYLRDYIEWYNQGLDEEDKIKY